MEMRRGNNVFALKLWRSKPRTWIHSAILLQPFLFLKSQRLMVSFLEYFLTVFSEHKLSAAHLHTPANSRRFLFSQQLQKQVRSTSALSAHLYMQNPEQEENALQQHHSPQLQPQLPRLTGRCFPAGFGH